MHFWEGLFGLHEGLLWLHEFIEVGDMCFPNEVMLVIADLS